jgi:hypothetical protein
MLSEPVWMFSDPAVTTEKMEMSGADFISEWPVGSGDSHDSESNASSRPDFDSDASSDRPPPMMGDNQSLLSPPTTEAGVLSLPSVSPFVHNFSFKFAHTGCITEGDVNSGASKRKHSRQEDSRLSLSSGSSKDASVPLAHFLGDSSERHGEGEGYCSSKHLKLDSDLERVKFSISNSTSDLCTPGELGGARFYLGNKREVKHNTTAGTIFSDSDSSLSDSEDSSTPESTSNSTDNDENSASGSWRAKDIVSKTGVGNRGETDSCGGTLPPSAGEGTEVQEGSPDVEECQPMELMAQTRLARWWRRHGQHLLSLHRHSNADVLPSTTNPNTLLFHVARFVIIFIYLFTSFIDFILKKRLLALVRDLFTFSSKVIKMFIIVFKRTFECKKEENKSRKNENKLALTWTRTRNLLLKIRALYLVSYA